MTLVGELVLARNHLTQLTAQTHARHRSCSPPQQHLNAITSDLPDSVMRTRLQPIHTAWARFPRVVRDLAMALGKQVRVRTEGEETELDRSVIEEIGDPLMHLVRNAVDHGIEPAERGAAGKPARRHGDPCRPRRRSGHDPGGGRRPRDRRRAGPGAGDRPRHELDAETANTLSALDTIELIFQPGFSTAEKVTELSGRGVGMDVVRRTWDRSSAATLRSSTEAGCRHHLHAQSR